MSPKKIRLQKYCSEKGLASRRKSEEYIKKGWITVNGEVVKELGVKVDPQKDKVELVPEAKDEKKKFIYILLNKPAGHVTNLPKKGEREAKELLPVEVRGLVHAVGRLDKDSEGLLLFTNDGVAAHRLTSPEFDHEKEYEVTADKKIAERVVAKYRRGLVILGEKTKPVGVRRIGGNVYRFILREGKNRQIRRMLNNLGYKVLKLKRIRIANLNIGDLKPGHFRSLTGSPLSVC
ncbi:MAG: pseudouridine synthase [Candidatus Margulisiibacteriota bacterium]|nr:pseudouridine synthase [Candidatus Margulisiibacteriota bacterium]